MSVQIIETDTHVFEFAITPDTPGRCKRTATIRLLSGEELTLEQWDRVKEMIVRTLIDQGNQVLRVDAMYEEKDENES